jgi:hypothetical protein
VYVTWQLADVAFWLTSVHGELVNEPTPLLAEPAVPVGVVAPINAVSVTVTVHVVAWFSATDEGEQVIAVAVGSLPRLIDVDPWLARWIVSPEYDPVIVWVATATGV